MDTTAGPKRCCHFGWWTPAQVLNMLVALVGIVLVLQLQLAITAALDYTLPENNLNRVIVEWAIVATELLLFVLMITWYVTKLQHKLQHNNPSKRRSRTDRAGEGNTEAKVKHVWTSPIGIDVEDLEASTPAPLSYATARQTRRSPGIEPAPAFVL